ncbi:hypothetical protein [Sulfurovum sp.]|jgi:hypothetical protein|uniref:hypothetical protein n=1 Tax=Sulfurovum sp. TaxID=1969726 RepID=UPI002A358726|nr:hypothetical protein [Sulfurovum sp.]MDY0402792.1 hypothetical protein [Sulfurovum sp.]
MHTLKLNIKDSVFDKVIYFLNNLPNDDVQIVENIAHDDLSYLEEEIDKGLNSGTSKKSHETIVSDIKSKYA